MTIALRLETVADAQSLQSRVARLGEGFARMHSLGTELRLLDAVGQDICHTQASIRRDIANTVLQTAFSLKKSQDVAAAPSQASTANETVELTSDAQATDLWATKIVRWADRVGRGLFGFSAARPAVLKSGQVVPPAQKR